MYVKVSVSKNSKSYYIVESYRQGNKVLSRIVEKVGTHNGLLAKGIKDPEEYAKKRAEELNTQLKEEVVTVNQTIDFKEDLDDSSSVISKDISQNIGWLYIHKIYEKLGLNDFFKSIKGKAKYDLNQITEYLVVNRFLFPGSKLSAFLSKDKLFNSPDYSLSDGYRLLTHLDTHNDELQKILFEGTKNIISLNTDVLYYDCTNFYFECEEQDDNIYSQDGDIIQWGLRRYGASKEHRPNPIVQMGLFTDKNGIPMSYCIQHGSNNEQNTVIPLESRMFRDYHTSKFIYCSDGGLGSYDNRFYNTLHERDYVVTQSLKKTAEEELKCIFTDLNWKYVHDDKPVSLELFKKILDKKMNNEELTPEEQKVIEHDMIYKAYPIKRKVPLNLLKNVKLKGTVEMEETIFITFSAKYYLYQKQIFNRQLENAKEWLKKDPDTIKKGPNDIRRFIKTIAVTKQGEVAEEKCNDLDQDVIDKECRFHGFYAVATSLDKSINEILEINSSRWKIEQSFRILKSDFDARPIFASTPEHIRGHFAICYIAILIYRILEKQLNSLHKKNETYSSTQILNTIRNMNVINQNGAYYQSIYTGSKILNDLEKIYPCKLNKKFYKTKELKEKFM
jgi:hypothetical protein